MHENHTDAAEVRPVRLHGAARFSDAVQRRRQRRGLKRGLVATAVPYGGYGRAGADGWIRILGRVVLTRPAEQVRRPTTTQTMRGWRSFTSIPAAHTSVRILADGRSHTIETDRGGVIDAVVPVSLTPGWNTITMETGAQAPVSFAVFLVDPAVRFGIISDVDDTVMVTALPRPLVAAWNTFIRDEHARLPVPGMAVLLDRFARDHPGSPVIYLSTGAWNVAPTLTRFLSRHLYPAGALLLTDWGPTQDHWFRSGSAHKKSNLARLAEEFPEIQWLLIGDDGQHDIAHYAEFAHNHPDRVFAVAIRQLSTSEAVLNGGRSSEQQGTETPWAFAPDGAGLLDELRRVRPW